ncbi:MAG: DUF2059 domain-containing protein [Myxococcota bacterium]
MRIAARRVSARARALMLALTFVFALAPAAARAQGEAAANGAGGGAAAHDPAKIRALIAQSGAGALGDQLVGIVEQQILDGLRDAQGRVPDAAPAVVREVVGEVLGERQPELVARMVDVYARAFSPAEIDELLAFYGSPVGGKLVAQLPTLMNASLAEGQAWVGARRAEINDRLVAALRDAGVEVAR